MRTNTVCLYGAERCGYKRSLYRPPKAVGTQNGVLLLEVRVIAGLCPCTPQGNDSLDLDLGGGTQFASTRWSDVGTSGACIDRQGR